jgi:MFS family permease
VPAGPWIVFRRKRPVMIAADLARFAALVSVPVAASAGALTYAQLCVVAVIQATGGIVFMAASGAHLKALVPASARAAANARFEATFWTVNTTGPPLGGALISAVGATASLAVDAVTFLLSAVGVRSLRVPEPPPPARVPAPSRWAGFTAGWQYILRHRELRALYLNSLLFGAGIMASAPLLAVLMLRELSFPPWQYGLALGLPCAGGVLGAVWVRRVLRRRGQRFALLAFGVGRSLWTLLLPFTPAGLPGLAVVITSSSLLLVSAGGFNPVFTTYRMEAVEDAYLSRVIAAWSISTRTAQPIGIAVGGALAALTSTRTAMAVVALLVTASIALLPWCMTESANTAELGDLGHQRDDPVQMGRGRQVAHSREDAEAEVHGPV